MSHHSSCGADNMKTQSEAIRNFRTSRNLSQHELASGICARTTLSSFELQGTYISSDLLFKFLEKMNISLEDYQFYLHEGINEKEYYLNLTKMYSPDLKQTQSPGFENFITEKAKSSQDIFWTFILLRLNLNVPTKHYAYIIDSEMKQQIKDLQNHLTHVTVWDSFELMVFGNLVPFLPMKFINARATVLMHEWQLNPAKNRQENTLLATAIIGKLIVEQDYDSAKALITFLEKQISLAEFHYYYVLRFFNDLISELRGLYISTMQLNINYDYLNIFADFNLDQLKQNLLNFREEMLD